MTRGDASVSLRGEVRMRRRDFLALGIAGMTVAGLGLPALAGDGDNDAATQLALVEKDAGSLGFYALPGGTRTGGIELGGQLQQIVVDASGRHAYVAQYGVSRWHGPEAGEDRVVVVDLVARRLQRTIELSPYRHLRGIRMDAAGRLYVLAEIDSVLIRFDDPVNSAAPDQVIALGGAHSHDFVIRRDGRRAWIADTLSGRIISVDPHDPTAAPIRRHSGKGPQGCCLSPDETVLYVVNRHDRDIVACDARDLRALRRAPTCGEAGRVVALPDGRLVVSNDSDHSLSLLRPDTLAEERRIALAAAAPGLDLDVGGHHLYLGLDDDSVAVIDTLTWRTQARFATRAGPDAAAVLTTPHRSPS